MLQELVGELLDDYLFDADFFQLSSLEHENNLRELYSIADVLEIYEDTDDSTNV